MKPPIGSRLSELSFHVRPPRSIHTSPEGCKASSSGVIPSVRIRLSGRHAATPVRAHLSWLMSQRYNHSLAGYNKGDLFVDIRIGHAPAFLQLPQ